MLLNLYLFLMTLFTITLILVLIKKHNILLKTTLSLLVIVNMLFLVIILKIIAFIIFILGVSLYGIYELSKHYRIHWALMIPISLVFTGIIYATTSLSINYFYIMPLYLGTIGMVFFAPASIIRKKAAFYLVAFFMILPGSMALIDIYRTNPIFIIMIFVFLQFNDILGYLMGKKLGKTKIVPRLSPNKSLEGYIFSLIGIILAMVVFHTIAPLLNEKTIMQRILFFVFFCVSANIGDLHFSSLKRKLEIKDFSNLIPGHGGILDRFDSFYFLSVFFFVFTYHQII